MKITIEAEPKELAAFVLNLQKQLDAEAIAEAIAETWSLKMNEYENKLKIRNPNPTI